MAHMLYQTKRLNDNLIQLLALYKDVGKPGYPFDVQPQLVRGWSTRWWTRRDAAAVARHRLETTYPQHAIWTLDEDLVIGVLVHAINNAIRYTRDRSACHARGGRCLELRVEDNGEGFRKPCWKRAARHGWHGRRREFLTNSSGLGLYFSSEVAKMHKHRGQGGSIALENGGTLGGGCFILRLP
jgi:K+-sensing histidine kinase KdpD